MKHRRRFLKRIVYAIIFLIIALRLPFVAAQNREIFKDGHGRNHVAALQR